jgi:hypothetical protein
MPNKYKHLSVDPDEIDFGLLAEVSRPYKPRGWWSPKNPKIFRTADVRRQEIITKILENYDNTEEFTSEQILQILKQIIDLQLKYTLEASRRNLFSGTVAALDVINKAAAAIDKFGGDVEAREPVSIAFESMSIEEMREYIRAYDELHDEKNSPERG